MKTNSILPAFTLPHSLALSVVYGFQPREVTHPVVEPGKDRREGENAPSLGPPLAPPGFCGPTHQPGTVSGFLYSWVCPLLQNIVAGHSYCPVM